MGPTFSPAKAIPQFNCAQRSRLPIGFLLLTLALFLTRQAAADVISFPGVTVPQTVTAEPASDCLANYQDCSGGAESSFTVVAPEGTPILGISSVYSFGYVNPEREGAGGFLLYFDGTIMGSVYNGSTWVAPAIGDTVGPAAAFRVWTSHIPL